MLPRHTFLLLSGMFMTITGATAQAEPMPVTEVEGIQEYRLENGLKVLLFPDASKPQVTVNLTVFVGSRHEGYGEAGMAHLLEHMLFKGTPDHPNIPKVLKELGANFNGTTWLDRTNYYETFPANAENLDAVLRLEADRFVNSHIAEEDLKSEMTVVRNEFEMGENSPSRVLAQRIMSAAYDWHNYGQSTIGNRADIERVPIDRLQRFYKKYYQPDNAMVIVAGAFDPEQTLQAIDKYFGAIPPPERELDVTYTEEPPQDGDRMVTVRRVGNVGQCGAVYHIPAGPHPDYVPIDVLEHILTSSPSGRLYKGLVETKLAASVSGAAFALHDPGVLRIMAEASPGVDPRDLLAKLVEITETIGEEGVTEEEVERAKLYWLKTWEMYFADTSKLAIQLSEWAAQGDWRLLFLYRDRLEAVTVEDVNRVARQYLKRNNRTAGVFVPTEAPERSTIPSTPSLAEMIGDYQGREGIAVGEAFDVSPENIENRTERVTLASGVKAAFLPKKTRGESVILRLTLRYGSAESLQGLTTACEGLPALMMRGTRELTRQQIQDELNKNRARMSPSGSVGEATFEIETRREYLPAVLDILRQVLREPTLPEEELELIRSPRISSHKQQLTDPTALARVALSRAISPEYPPEDVRYVATVEEEVERWETVTRKEIARLYSEFLNGTHGELAVVGDFDPEETRSQLEAILSDWTSGIEYAHIPRTGDVEVNAKRQVINTPDKENATYLAGTVFPMQDMHPDYLGLFVGNYVLGSSGLSSRLGDRVRQQEGLSYGVGSFLRASSTDPRTTFLAYAITNPENIEKVHAAIREEIDLLLAEGVSAEELAAAQRGYLERKTVERSDDKQLASILADTLHLDRDMSFHAAREQRIREITADEVLNALKTWLDPEKIAVIMAGDFDRDAPSKEVTGSQPESSEESGPDEEKKFQTTESGLKYRVLKQGEGKKPQATSTVVCHYKGWLDDGKEFDSSYKRGEPATFPLNAVIPGWTEGLQLIQEGGKIELEIPSKLGYGDQGAGNGLIPPGATLHFEVELISVR
jgi:zinc protease